MLWDEWEYHLIKKHDVRMDNDGWWFVDGVDDYGNEVWVSGGDTAADLCELLLYKLGVTMEYV